MIETDSVGVDKIMLVVVHHFVEGRVATVYGGELLEFHRGAVVKSGLALIKLDLDLSVKNKRGVF